MRIIDNKWMQDSFDVYSFLLSFLAIELSFLVKFNLMTYVVPVVKISSFSYNAMVLTVW